MAKKDRFVRQVHAGSKEFEGYAILWGEELDAGIFTHKTRIQQVKRITTQEKVSPSVMALPVVLHMVLRDKAGMVNVSVGHAITARFTSKGFHIRFALDTTVITEDLRNEVEKFLKKEEVLMTVSAFENAQVGINTDRTFSDFPVGAIFMYTEEQAGDDSGEEKEEKEEEVKA